MSVLNKMATVALCALVPLPALAAGVELNTHVLAEARSKAADGTTRITLAPAARVTPGDRLVYQIAYRNAGKAPARDVVITNPVPQHLIYAGVADNSAAPELSVDGQRFGTLAALVAPGSDGKLHPATMADVRVVRWRLDPIAAGGAGQVSYRAILK